MAYVTPARSTATVQTSTPINSHQKSIAEFIEQNISPIKEISPPKPRPKLTKSCGKGLVILATGLSQDQDFKDLVEFSMKIGAQVVQDYGEHVTHLVCRTDSRGRAPRTPKYVMSLAARKKIVTFDWVSSCLAKSEFLEITPFHPVGDQSSPEMYSSNAALKVIAGDAAPLRGHYLYFNFNGLNAEKRRNLPMVDYLTRKQYEDVCINLGARIVERFADIKELDVRPQSKIIVSRSYEKPVAQFCSNRGLLYVSADAVIDCVSCFSRSPIVYFKWDKAAKR